MSEQSDETEFVLFYTELEGEVWFGVLAIYDYNQWLRELADHKFVEYRLLGLKEAQRTATDSQPYWVSPELLGTREGRTYFKIPVDPELLTKARYGKELKATRIPFGKSPLCLRFTTVYWARQSGSKQLNEALDLFEAATSGTS